MTFEQTRENLALVLAENAFINICECSDILNAIEALEKQIPKKPVDVHYPWAICASCGGSICLKYIQEHIHNEENTYCEHCGQALDWSEQE